jgi:V/A-type H+-transporting ATPase subunit C
MIDDYGYINARIRAMKSELLPPDFYEELLSATELSTLFDLLKGTSYAEDITKAKTKESRELDVLVTAFRMNMERHFRKILNFSSGDPFNLFQIVLARYDIYNVKTILRGKIQGVEEGEIRASLLPAGILDEVRLTELLKQETASNVLDILATWGIVFPFVIGRTLVKAVREKNIQLMETYLEEEYFKWAFEQLSKGNGNKEILREVLISLVDMRNIMASLILLKDGIKPLGRIQFIPGGKLSNTVMKSLENAESLEEGIEIVKKTEYGKPLREREIRDLPTIERILEKAGIEKALSLKREDPLGIGIGIYYIWAKETEITNLRTITFGIAFGVPRHEIRESIVIP